MMTITVMGAIVQLVLAAMIFDSEKPLQAEVSLSEWINITAEGDRAVVSVNRIQSGEIRIEYEYFDSTQIKEVVVFVKDTAIDAVFVKNKADTDTLLAICEELDNRGITYKKRK